jgi:hypothetical protein
MKEIFVGKINAHFSQTFSCFATRVSAGTARELVPYARNDKTWSMKLTTRDAIFSSVGVPKGVLIQSLNPGK